MKLISSLNNLIKEQITSKSTEETFEIPPQSYPNGIFSVSKMPEVQKSIDGIITKIVDFSKKHKTSEFNVNIETGESAVTNMNREVNPSTPLKPGALAKLRAQSVAKYMTDKLNAYVSSGELTSIPKINVLPTNVENKTQKHTYTKGKDKPNDPKYNEDKFIKITIPAKGVTETCLANAQIIFTYKHTKVVTSCSGNHQCNRAKFKVLLGGYYLGDINLNNDSCNPNIPGNCDRSAAVMVTPEIAKAIAENPEITKKQSMFLVLECLYPKNEKGFCHASAPTVSVRNDNGYLLKPFCVDQHKEPSVPTMFQVPKTYIASFNPCMTEILASYPSDGQPVESDYIKKE